MTYISIATFVKEDRVISELASRRKGYVYPSSFKNVTSYMDVQGGRVITTFETDDVASIMVYSASFPDVTFDIFPVVPTEQAWEIYLSRKK
jgi:hypothetical protein